MTLNGGALQNQSEILKKHLEKINYPHTLSFRIFQEENPTVFLQIIHHAIISFNAEFYKSLIEKGYELFSKSDQKFMDQVYKLMIAEFDHKPPISLQNFFTNTYLQQKLILTNTLIDYILKAAPLQKPVKKQSVYRQEDDSMKQKMIQQVEIDEPRKAPTPASDSFIPKQSSKQSNISYPEKQNHYDYQETNPHQNSKQFKQQVDSSKEEVPELRNQVKYKNFQEQVEERENEEQQQPQRISNRQKDSNLDRPVTQKEFKGMMELIVSMNSVIQETIKKFDSFQKTVNTQMSNMQAQLIVLDGEVKLLKAKQQEDR